MANPQLENGYTRIANELLEAIVRADLSGAELRIMLGVVRFTYGFQKKSGKLSASFLAGWSGLHIQTVKSALLALREKRMIICLNPEARGITAEWEVNEDFENWIIGSQMATSSQ